MPEVSGVELAGDLEDLSKRTRLPNSDPLNVVKQFSQTGDLEVAGLIASAFAFGTAKAISSAVGRILAEMEKSPRDFLLENGSRLSGRFAGFRYRFIDGKALGEFLKGISRGLREAGSLEALFLAGYRPGADMRQAIGDFVGGIRAGTRDRMARYLLPDPSRGSACKRMNLFLRWMVRREEPDLGLWKGIRPEDLVIPLDVHVGRVARRLGLTERKTNDWATAMEITESLKRFSAWDPTKYDLCLSKLGALGACRKVPACGECSVAACPSRGKS